MTAKSTGVFNSRFNINYTANPTELSWCMWILKPTGSGGNVWLFQKGSTRGRFFTALQFNQDYSGVDGQWIATGFTPLNDVLYHIAVTHDRSSLANTPKFYVDGVLYPTTVLATPTGTLANATQYTFFNQAGATQGWNWEADDIRIYSKVLTQEEILSIYNTRSGDSVRDNLQVHLKCIEGQAGAFAILRDYSPFKRNGLSGTGYTIQPNNFRLNKQRRLA
jgi:hypothetical protein